MDPTVQLAGDKEDEWRTQDGGRRTRRRNGRVCVIHLQDLVCVSVALWGFLLSNKVL